MNWGGFQALSQLWLLALLAPLVLFYFLKLKRPRAEIPSLVLWRQVLQDHRVNSPFQKFKRNLLLLLQILLLLFLILAALQPFWRGGPGKHRRLPVLVDCSASMGALDKPGGVSRLAEAKRRVREMIDGLAVGPGALPDLVRQHSRANSPVLRTTNGCCATRLDQIEVADVASDLEQALRLVQALGRSEPFDEVLLFSDGNFPPRVNFDLSFKLNYQRLSPAGPNLGITALSAQRAVAGGWDVFVQIEGSADAEGNASVELFQDGNSIANERITIARGHAQRMVFQTKGERAAALRVQLTPDGFDSLAADNTAYLDLPESRPLRVFVPKSLVSYRLALQGIQGIQLFPQETGDEASGAFDLVMSDRPQDLELAARTRLSVGFIPPELQRFVELGTNGSAVVDWRRDAPVLQHVQLADLVVLDQPRFAANAGEGDLENLGYEVLIHGQRGPLLVRKQDSDGVAVRAVVPHGPFDAALSRRVPDLRRERCAGRAGAGRAGGSAGESHRRAAAVDARAAWPVSNSDTRTNHRAGHGRRSWNYLRRGRPASGLLFSLGKRRATPARGRWSAFAERNIAGRRRAD